MNKQNTGTPHPKVRPPHKKPTLSNEERLTMLEQMVQNAPNDKTKQTIEQQIIELKNLLNNE
jgi:nicotinic acid mononucleotide adenylyltransferase